MENERIKMPAGAIIACILITVFLLALIAGLAMLIKDSVAKTGRNEPGAVTTEVPSTEEPGSVTFTEAPTAQPTAAPSEGPSAGLDIGGTQASPDTAKTEIIAKCMNAVVSIDISIAQYGEQVTGSGSGVLITDSGYIATCNHVVEGASGIYVYLNDGTQYKAELIGNDPVTDIAVIKIEGSGFPHATIGSSEALKVGDDVYAIGNALGELSNTVTEGIISGIGRDIEIDGQSMTLLQTSAAINSGNSGGALFLWDGSLIGIVNAKSSGSTTSGASIEGLGFAVPIDLAKTVITDLMDHGFVTGRPYLGVSTKNVSYGYGFFSSYTYPQVVSIIEGSPADLAGIQVNDVITKINGVAINSSTALRVAINKFQIGDTITVTVQRGNSTFDIQVTLQEKTSRT